MSTSKVRGPIQKSLKYVPNVKAVTTRAKMLKVPHKHPSNDTFEPFWKFGRYVCQLKRLTINYCSDNPGSRGIRRFLDLEVDQFIENNPEVAVYLQERRGQSPRLVANYLNGNSRIIQIPNNDDIAIREWLERLRNESGRQWRSERLHQPWLSDNPSIQGTWSPFLNKPPVDINDEHYVDK
ncbi:large ribosomal subunit protein mL43-like [Clytia hemisphaerica]|eukprot:TCONS_00004616-protein